MMIIITEEGTVNGGESLCMKILFGGAKEVKG
jgi:hypothetical protein